MYLIMSVILSFVFTFSMSFLAPSILLLTLVTSLEKETERESIRWMLDGDLSVCFKRTIRQWKRWLITGVLTPTSLLSSVPVSCYILILTRLFKFWNLSMQKNDCFWSQHWWWMFLHMLVFIVKVIMLYFTIVNIYFTSLLSVLFIL